MRLRLPACMVLILILVFGSALAGEKAISTKDLFQPGKVWKLHLQIPTKEYEAMQPRWAGGFFGIGATPLPKPSDKSGKPVRQVHRNKFAMDLAWATGSVTLGDHSFHNVGVRYKGNGTIGDASRSIKKSIKIELDHFGGSERFLGIKTINLNCGVADPSKCRETLGYSLYRAAGVPAPRTALAEVWLTVPGKHDKELLGVFTMVEAITKPVLRALFKDDAGLLMKPEGQRDFQYRGEDWERYKNQFFPKREATRDEANRVIAFSKLIHKADDAEFQKEIGSFLDIDAYLRYLAVTAFVANLDSFFSLGHNYYLYLHSKTGKFHFIPWDLDRAFANLPFLAPMDKQTKLSFLQPYAGTHRLTERLLAMPGIGEKYQNQLKELAAGCFSKERLQKDLDILEKATKDLVIRDSKAALARKEGPPKPVQPSDWEFARPPSLRTFIEERTESMAEQIAGKTKGLIPMGGFFIHVLKKEAREKETTK